MKIRDTLNFIWEEFIYGGHITALAALSLVLTSSIVLDIDIKWHFLAIVYLITYLIYFFNRYKEHSIDSLDNLKRFEHFKRYISIIPIWFIFVVFLYLFILFNYSPLTGSVFSVVLLCLGIFYSLFLKKLTKKIIAFKSLYISFMWSLLVVFLAFYHSLDLSFSVFMLFLFVFFRMFLHTSFFDIKDIQSDKKEELLTLPIVLSQRKLIYFLNLVSFISLVPIILGVYLGNLPIFSLSLVFTFFVSFYYLNSYKKYNETINIFSQLAISGEKILWIFIILIGKELF